MTTEKKEILDHVMIDLETLSLGGNAVILSIGAVAFDKHGLLKTFYRKIDLNSTISKGFDIEADTLYWWMKQDKKVLEELTEDVHGIESVLVEFARWLPDEAFIWGNGAAFDNPVLKNAYKKLNVCKVPWEHWNDRCYRTVKNMFSCVKARRVGDHHNALDDAKTQALHLIQINDYVVESGLEDKVKIL